MHSMQPSQGINDSTDMPQPHRTQWKARQLSTRRHPWLMQTPMHYQGSQVPPISRRRSRRRHSSHTSGHTPVNIVRRPRLLQRQGKALDPASDPSWSSTTQVGTYLSGQLANTPWMQRWVVLMEQA